MLGAAENAARDDGFLCRGLREDLRASSCGDAASHVGEAKNPHRSGGGEVGFRTECCEDLRASSFGGTAGHVGDAKNPHRAGGGEVSFRPGYCGLADSCADENASRVLFGLKDFHWAGGGKSGFRPGCIGPVGVIAAGHRGRGALVPRAVGREPIGLCSRLMLASQKLLGRAVAVAKHAACAPREAAMSSVTPTVRTCVPPGVVIP